MFTDHTIIDAGIDEEDWNPASDKHIAHKFSASNFKSGKAKCKAALQEELGLPVRSDVPMIGFIGRLDYQKGADLVLAAAPWLIQQDCQLVCLGTGDSGLEVILITLFALFASRLYRFTQEFFESPTSAHQMTPDQAQISYLMD